MDDKRDVFDIIKEFPEKQELNPEILQDAKELAQKLYGKKTKKNSFWSSKWTKIAACVLTPCILLVAVLTPILLHNTQKSSEKYFTDSEVIWTSVDSIENYVQENNLSVHYFSMDNAEIQALQHTIKATGELAFLQQDALVFHEDYFDMLTLYIVPSNHTFETFSKYRELNSIMTVNGTEISYTENLNNGTYEIDSKFIWDKVTYYLSVQSSKEETLRTYIEQLLR